MRVAVKQEDLVSALSIVSRATKARSTLPTLSSVLLEAQDAGLVITGTDLEIYLSSRIPAQVEELGQAVLPAKTLLDLVRRMEGEWPVEISVENNTATIAWHRSRIKLHGMAPNLFPPAPRAENTPILFEADPLGDILRRTAFAASTDETRPILTGVYLHGDGERIRGMATDSYRVAMVEREVPGFEGSAIVPSRSLFEALRIIKDQSSVAMSVTESVVSFQAGDAQLVTRVIDGEYPKILDLLPADYDHTILVPRNDLIAALQRALLFTSDSLGKKHVVRLSIGKDLLTITGADPDLGEAEEQVPISDGLDESMEIGFNARYLLDGLKATDADEVEIGLIGPLQAVRIKGVGDSAFTYIVLPVKI